MIAVPEIMYVELNESDKYVVICSDGVWEFLSNSNVMDLVTPCYLATDPETACEKLVNESVRQWKMEDDVIDDITAISLFFNI